MNEVIKSIADAGGIPYMVGGCVRDKILGLVPKDIDIEVFRLSYDNLNQILQQFGKTDCVGVSFGVIKLTTHDGTSFDFSLPRTDSKNGVGHKGFDVEINQELTLQVAFARRDFTINAMGINMITNELVDHYCGQGHLQGGLLHPTSEAFIEDPLRILRGFQFSARFGMTASKVLRDFAPVCVADFHSLPLSRIWGEWEKWILKGVYYSASMRYLVDILSPIYQNISALNAVPQEPEWHPEGNVLVHTGFVLDYMALYCVKHSIEGDRRIILILAALCHDFGKLTHTQVEDGRIKSKGHEQASEPFAREFLSRIGCPHRFIEPVIGLVINHMASYGRQSEKSVRKLSARLYKYNTCIADLAILMEADKSGRPPLPQGQPESVAEMLQLSAKENCTASQPVALISGGEIMGLGYEGPMIGKIQRRLYEMQLNGSFSTGEEGIKKIKSFVKQL